MTHDHAAWLHRIYTDHHQQIFTHLRRKTGDWHLAQDLTSATFLKAALYADSYTDRNPAAWLQRIATRLMLDYYGSAYYRYHAFLDEDHYSEVDGDEPRQPFYERPDPDADPADIFITALDEHNAANRLTALLAAIDNVRSNRQRELLQLYLDGATTETACEALRTNPNALKQIRTRAIRSVRAQLGVAA